MVLDIKTRSLQMRKCALGYQPPPLFFATPPLPLNLQTLQASLFRQFPLHILPTSHLLKVTKFSVKISQFKFLAMTEKNIYVLSFLSLNI